MNSIKTDFQQRLNVTEEMIVNQSRTKHVSRLNDCKESLKLLLLTHLDDKGKFTVYECDYCGDTSYNLDEFERHCYNEGQDHRDANLERIKAEAIHDITKANAELRRI
jgi:hypothetical protein